MKLLERILVATDFSRASEDAVRMASYLARHFESTVDLFHVKAPAEDWEEPPSKPDENLPEHLDHIAKRMVEEGVQGVESVLAEGEEFEEIDQYAKDRNVNLIMVGAGEMVESGQVFLGTTAARLRRWATKPVWIVKPGSAPPLRRILCPVDLQPASERALKNAIHFARRLDADLTVLTVTNEPLGEKGDQQELRSAAEVGPPELREPHLHEFDEFLRKQDFYQVRCEKVIRRGRPRYEVGQVARQIEADLIVMGSTGRTGLSHMFIGGVARRVAQELPCSIMTVRSQQPIALSIEGEIPRVDTAFCASHPAGERCERFQYGEELLSRGLAEEAIELFHECVTQYEMCANAWLQLGEAHTRFGHYEKARQCAAKAEEALRRQENQRIEEELRGDHILHRRFFGI